MFNNLTENIKAWKLNLYNNVYILGKVCKEKNIKHQIIEDRENKSIISIIILIRENKH